MENLCNFTLFFSLTVSVYVTCVCLQTLLCSLGGQRAALGSRSSLCIMDSGN